MEKSFSLRRLAENEVYFRQKNRAIEESFNSIKKLAEEENQRSFVEDEDLLLDFFCECSDENCRTRIPLRRSQYDEIHKAHDYFVVVPGHEVPQLETVITKTDSYNVVQKRIVPPANSSKLNPTPVQNV